MNNISRLFLFIFISIIFISFTLPGIFFPSDILSTFPQYTEEKNWSKPMNSLLADPVFQFEPWRKYAKDRLLSGEIPFLNDKNALGSPFFANQISAIFYPLNILYYFLPLGPSLYLIHLLKLFFLFVFSYIYFRSVQCKRDLSLLGASGIAFSSFPIVWLHWPQTNVYLLFPLILYITERIRLGSQRIYIWYVLLSVSYFLGVLGGHPETLFHIGMLHGIYIIIRLKSGEKIIKSVLFVFLGFCLSAFQLIPFLEYLFTSYMLEYRLTSENYFFQPLSSFILNIFPFLFGAPHLDFYKPFWPTTNFQEVIGGYVGVFFLVLGVIGSVKLPKNSLVLYWVCTLVITFGFSYAIFPFSFINTLPVMETSANHRFVGFMGISLVVLTVLFIQYSLLFKLSPSINVRYRLLLTGLFAIGILYLFFPKVTIPVFDEKFLTFLSMLKFHIFLICTSSFFCFILLRMYIKNQKFIYFGALLVSVAFQNLFLFLSYNPILDKTDYYPQTEVTKTLSNLSPGVFLEVGNPTLHENSNLMYGLSSIENYDALEIKGFKRQFNDIFDERNHWGNVEEVSEEGLTMFGIKYVLSDYNVSFKKINLYKDDQQLLRPLIAGEPIELPLTTDKTIVGIRLLPATYNRKNTCILTVAIGRKGEKPIFTERVRCDDFRNNMFFTFNTPDINNSKTNGYQLTLHSSAIDTKNTVSFFGSRTAPYVSVITSDSSNLPLTLVQKTKTTYVFLNSKADETSTTGTVQKVNFGEERIELLVKQEKDDILQIKRANYPGWQVSIDNRKADILESPLLSTYLPKGSHFVQFTYTPYSFILGCFISFTTFAVLIFFLLKSNSTGLYYEKIHKFYKNFQQKSTTIPVRHHVTVLFFSLVAVAILLMVSIAFIPVSFQLPDTSAINWLTVHQYPKNQDYFFFFSFLPVVILLPLLIWITWVLKR